MITHNVIVIGASAGSVTPLRQIARGLPPEFSVPIVLVIHVSPRVPSRITSLLGYDTAMPVKEIEDKAELQPGILVAPPNYHVLIEKDGTLALDAGPPVSYSRPSIDVLFDSAAHACGSGAIGLALSCANTDGLRGAQTIVSYGGHVIIQDPEEAEYNALPQAIIEQVSPIHVARACDIPALLCELAANKKL
jgi:two-component system chemotaxis response regulator CheB